uniref:SCP domain-containing protein n=1 Tax=Parastrongyloides trichosuri TaxID=131310 RepID=A0A0N4ZN92_PARTI
MYFFNIILILVLSNLFGECSQDQPSEKLLEYLKNLQDRWYLPKNLLVNSYLQHKGRINFVLEIGPRDTTTNGPSTSTKNIEKDDKYREKPRKSTPVTTQTTTLKPTTIVTTTKSTPRPTTSTLATKPITRLTTKSTTTVTTTKSTTTTKRPTTVTTTKTTTTTTTEEPTTTTVKVVRKPILTIEDWNKMVQEKINDFRKRHHAKPLEYSTIMRLSSQRYADKLKDSNAEVINDHTNDYYGENVCFGDNPELFKCIDQWYYENSKYDYNKNEMVPGAKHFTQMVWKATKRIGCGYAQSSKFDDKYYVVCRFYPKGNVEGKFKNNIQKP